MYHVDLSTRTPEACNTNINVVSDFANSYKVWTSYVNDVTMVYNSRPSNHNLTDCFFIKHTTPTVSSNMSAFQTTVESSGVTFMNCQLKYINTNTLICVINLTSGDRSNPPSSRNCGSIICDIGRYINHLTVYKVSRVSREFNGGYLYGQSYFYNARSMFPIVNALPIRITGKTRTITAFNHTKNISGKAFELGFTNMPLWGYEVNGSGKPPGVPSPTLDANGYITGWSW
jgi:hypothetical protein